MSEDVEINEALLKAHPQLAVAVFLFGLLVMLILSGGLTLWSIVFVRWRQGEPILSVEPWKPRSWGLIDALLVLAAAFVGQAFLVQAWAKATKVDLHEMVESDRISLSVMAVGSVSYLLAMALGILWLIARYAANFQHMGLAMRSMLPKIGLGLAATVMCLPVVAAISAIVTKSTETEYDHPLITELKQEGTFSAYAMAVFCAVVVAPLVEEFFFRVLLQGWLQSLPWSVGSWWWLIGCDSRRSTALMNDQSDDTSNHGEPAVSVADPTADPSTLRSSESSAEPTSMSNPYEPPVVPASLPQTSSLALAGLSESVIADSSTATGIALATPPIWPAVVIGILFGMAHFDYGLSFIPLSVLGIVLGLLYRAKHSIWPCFILHFALNSMSMIALGIALLLESVK